MRRGWPRLLLLLLLLLRLGDLLGLLAWRLRRGMSRRGRRPTRELLCAVGAAAHRMARPRTLYADTGSAGHHRHRRGGAVLSLPLRCTLSLTLALRRAGARARGAWAWALAGVRGSVRETVLLLWLLLLMLLMLHVRVHAVMRGRGRWSRRDGRRGAHRANLGLWRMWAALVADRAW